MNGENNWNPDLVASSAKNIQDVYNEISKNTLTDFDADITAISRKYDNYLSSNLSKLKEVESMYESANKSLNDLSASLSQAASYMRNANTNGSVNGSISSQGRVSHATYSSVGSNGVASAATIAAPAAAAAKSFSYLGNDTASKDTSSSKKVSNPEKVDVKNSETSKEETKESVTPDQKSTEISGKPLGEEKTNAAKTTGVAAATGLGTSVAAATSGSSPAKRGQGQIKLEKINSIPNDEQDKIKSKLKEVGFTNDEINNIASGKASVNKEKLDKINEELLKLYKTNPDLRKKLIEKYGFDIFNDDGTINKDKLALALLIDEKNPNDSYDIEKILSSLDKEYKVDDIINLIEDNGTTSLEDLIKKTPTIESNEPKQSGVIPLAAGLSVASASGIGTKAIIDKKKKNERNDDTDEDEDSKWWEEDEVEDTTLLENNNDNEDYLDFD